MKGVFQTKGNIIQYANKYLSILLNIPLDRIIEQPITNLFGEENKAKLQEAIEILYTSNGEIDRLISLKSVGNLPELQLHLNLVEGKDTEEIILGSIQASIAKEVVPCNSVNSRFNVLFENALDATIIYNYEKEEIVSVNAKAVQALEYNTADEMIGLSRLDFIPKTSKYAPGLDLHKYAEDHKKRILNGESFTSKGIFVVKNGKHIFSDTKLISNFNKRGEGLILLKNITNQLLEKKKKNLTKTKYRNIFEHSHEAIIYIDPSNQLPTICNTKAMQLFDLTTLEDVKKLRLADFVREKELDGIPVHDFYNKLVKKAIITGREETSFWVHKKTGETVRGYAILIKDNSDSEHPRIICFIRDITDLYNAQLALEEKNKELEKYITSNSQLENFAYFASHDLKAPLNTILSFSNLLQKKLANDDRKEVAEFLEFIVSSGEGMKTLIDDLLAYSLVNTTNLEVKQINLEKRLYVLLHSLDSVIKEKSAVIEVHNIPEDITVDPTKLKQVFQNLITNGIKFVKSGIKPKVVISCIEEKDHWLFSVKDNGIGISAEHQEKIFDLFKRLHSSGEYKGTGIGLAIVKKIVEQHGGTITLESEVGKGTTFLFTIAKDLASTGNITEINSSEIQIGASARA